MSEFFKTLLIEGGNVLAEISPLIILILGGYAWIKWLSTSHSKFAEAIKAFCDEDNDKFLEL